jgi:hypothetical protein
VAAAKILMVKRCPSALASPRFAFLKSRVPAAYETGFRFCRSGSHLSTQFLVCPLPFLDRAGSLGTALFLSRVLQQTPAPCKLPAWDCIASFTLSWDPLAVFHPIEPTGRVRRAQGDSN